MYVASSPDDDRKRVDVMLGTGPSIKHPWFGWGRRQVWHWRCVLWLCAVLGGWPGWCVLIGSQHWCWVLVRHVMITHPLTDRAVT